MRDVREGGEEERWVGVVRGWERGEERVLEERWWHEEPREKAGKEEKGTRQLWGGGRGAEMRGNSVC